MGGNRLRETLAEYHMRRYPVNPSLGAVIFFMIFWSIHP